MTLAPNPINFTYDIGSPTTIPASIALSLQTVGATPTGEIGFTLTPQNGSATVLLNGAGNPISGCIFDPAVAAGSLSDCAGHVLAINASIGNLMAGSHTRQARLAETILVSIPPINPVTLVANPPVSNAGFSVPVTVTVVPQAGLTVTPTAVTFNWTLGQPTIAAPTTATLNYTLIGSDTFLVTSDMAWATVTPVAPATNPDGSALSSFTVGINLAAAGAHLPQRAPILRISKPRRRPESSRL